MAVFRGILFSDCRGHAAVRVNHLAVGMKRAGEFADAVAHGEAGGDIRLLVGQIRAMHRQPQPLRALLEQRDSRFGKPDPLHLLRPLPGNITPPQAVRLAVLLNRVN